MLDDDLKVCNCAECGCELIALAQEILFRHLARARHPDPMPRRLAGRINDRPYCAVCLDVRRGNTSEARVPRQSEKMVS